MDEIIKLILDKKIYSLLKTIQSNYPDKLSNDQITNEYETIKNKIILTHYDSNSKPKSTSTKPKVTKKIISNEERCTARIWGNIYDRNTLTEITDIDPKYKVNDFMNLRINAFNKQYIIGTQCKRKKTNNNYCYQHNKHLPHGDYFELPTNELCFHYLKECNYI